MSPTSSQYRIIMVCTGNICRSPMAELMLAEAIAAEGLAGAVVDSAGITAYEVGRPIDPRAARKLTATGISSDRHVAREWRPEWFHHRELILALDVDHFGWLQQAAPDSESLSKIRMLRSFDPVVAGRDALDQGIEDPWYGGHADFDLTWDLIHAALPGIVAHVRAGLAQRRGPKLQQPGTTGHRVRSIS
ncbi:protein-tyrosine phosphatase [Arthrobacter ginsengisoli]|uniref:protein-tyrosine-phosphatase n=1 Tax=Arthrobacter ginsengisoli TaxID=1356565 RepID=A0ABU1UEF2_9MICC|nr:low molecular weight protein-tyrosine-phosphatase [Arthrobacter ginsengisoli]MDR7083520.1 protein-tyrosine phosphatase [Arthrobacter ginsengisoli]